MIPVVSIIGTSNSGKTTLLLKIIKELKRRNYKVATVKHHHEELELDRPGKDTFRHAEAGADQVALISPKKAGIFFQFDEEMTINEMITKITGVDIIITEGYKYGDKPKIEVIRKEIRDTLIAKPNELIAVASDFPLKTNVPIFDINNAKGIVDLLEEKFLCD